MAKSAGSRASKRKKTEDKVGKQLNQVRKDLAAIASTLGAVGSEKLRHAKSKANGFMKNARSKGGAVSKAEKKLYVFQDKLTKCIHKYPLSSVIIAAGIGFILSCLLR